MNFRASRAQQLRTLSRLTQALPVDHKLRLKLELCATDSLGYFYYCRQPACAHCRRRHIKRQFRAAQVRFAGRQSSDMAFVTVVLGGVRQLSDIADLVTRTRSTFRNVFHKHRARSKRWNGAEFLGWFEIDAICSLDMPLLGSERTALLTALGALPQGEEPTFVPTIHGVVSLNGLDYQQFRDALKEKWPHQLQVDVRQFYRHAPIEKNLFCSIRYALKRTCNTFLRGVNEDWPDEWLTAFEMWHYDWSRGFQSTRLSVGKRKMMRLSEVRSPQDNEDDLQPMPMVV